MYPALAIFTLPCLIYFHQALPDDKFDAEAKANLTNILTEFSDVCSDAEDIADHSEAFVSKSLDAVNDFCEGVLDGDITNANPAFDDVFVDLAAPCADFVDFWEEVKPEDVSTQYRQVYTYCNWPYCFQISKILNFTDLKAFDLVSVERFAFGRRYWPDKLRDWHRNKNVYFIFIEHS